MLLLQKVNFSFTIKRKIFLLIITINENIQKQFQSLHLQCVLAAKDSTFWIGTWEGLAKL